MSGLRAAGVVGRKAGGAATPGTSENPAKGSVLKLYGALWAEAQGRRGMLIGALTLLALAQCVLLAIPYCAGRAINVLQLEGLAGLGEAGLWLAAVVGVTACSWMLHGPGRVLERNVALTVRERVAVQLIGKVMRLPLAWHEAHHSGATAHRVQQSSHALTAFAQSQFIYLSSAVRLVGPLVALWWLNPWVGAAALAGFIVTAVCTVGFDRAMIRLAHQENDAERRYSSALIDSLGNSTTVLALRQGHGVGRLLRNRLASIFEPLRRSIVLNEAKWCTVDLSTKVLSCGLVALFVWLTSRNGTAAAAAGAGAVMLGSLFMVWEYAQQAGGVISAFASHFQTFARQHADYSSADLIRAAVDRVEPSGQAGSERAAVQATGSMQRLHIRDLTFAHDAARSSTPSLDRVNISLERGRRYALIGSSGCGKSTLLRVLAGLYTPNRIALDHGAGPAVVSAEEAASLLRSISTLVPQDAQVFEGTLSENLALCESLCGPPVPANYARAAQMACVTDFIDIEQGGLDAPVAEGAANWSGGQRARFSLARGVLAAEGSALVLLDEPTASLDPRTESQVYTNLFIAFADACVVSSIHRLELLSRFDEVIVMHEGRVVDQGPVALLLHSSEHLSRLLRTQSQAQPRAHDHETHSVAA